MNGVVRFYNVNWKMVHVAINKPNKLPVCFSVSVLVIKVSLLRHHLMVKYFSGLNNVSEKILNIFI